MSESEAWDRHTESFRNETGGRWRDYCDELHLRLLQKWLTNPGETVLKTDLFDETAGKGLLNQFAVGRTVLGIDISFSVTAAALRRSEHLSATVGDLRLLPFRNVCCDSIVSNSSLDHFRTRAELLAALAELHRVLRPGGALVITLDNPTNPIIALRRVFPHRVLKRLGLLPYPVGATLSLRHLTRELQLLGFEIQETDVIMHVPRVLVIPWCRWTDRRSTRSGAHAVRHLLCWEALARLPSRLLSGHFVAVRAVKA